MPTKRDKDRQKQAATQNRDSKALEVRNKEMALAVIGGQTITEVAKAHGLTRQTVSEILNGELMDELIEDADHKLRSLVTKAVQVVEGHLNENNLIAAISVLKNAGVLKEKHLHEHEVKTLPAVEIIRKDGTVVRMGLLEGEKK